MAGAASSATTASGAVVGSQRQPPPPSYVRKAGYSRRDFVPSDAEAWVSSTWAPAAASSEGGGGDAYDEGAAVLLEAASAFERQGLPELSPLGLAASGRYTASADEWVAASSPSAGLSDDVADVLREFEAAAHAGGGHGSVA